MIKITITLKDKKDGSGVEVKTVKDEGSNVSGTEKQASQVVYNGINAVLKELQKIK